MEHRVDDPVRASDHDRDTTAERLGDASPKAPRHHRTPPPPPSGLAATTRGDLNRLTADLPPSHAARIRADNARRAAQNDADERTWAAEWRYWTGGAAIMTAIWAVSALRAGEWTAYWPAAPSPSGPPSSSPTPSGRTATTENRSRRRPRVRHTSHPVGHLHIFDMDGTLLAGTTANLEIARHLGTLPELHDLEARFAARPSTRAASPSRSTGSGAYHPGIVAAAYTAATWLTGIADVCADIRARGEHSAVITMSPDFFARHLLDLGFDDVIASRFPDALHRHPRPRRILTPADKVRIAEELRARHGLAPAQCTAYGDSMSDAPLFRHLANTVAVNADHHLADIAALDYRGTDLTEAYALARTLPA